MSLATSSLPLPDLRRPLLRRCLEGRGTVRAIEAHNGLSALVGSRARADGSCEFGALWVSSLTSSAAQGLPDAEMYLIERRLDICREISLVSSKPLIVDADTGGDASALQYLVHRLEATGVSAVVIEDKRHPKRNSLADAAHELEDPDIFARKIALAQAARTTGDMLVFARLESLNAGQSVEDALNRARVYEAAGADGVMIHSRARAPDEVFAFLRRFHDLPRAGPTPYIMAVPTTYNAVTGRELFERGVSIVVYANHLLRAAHHAMEAVSRSILRHDRSLEADTSCTPVSQLLADTGNAQLLATDASPLRAAE